jgi:hypothetical protein
MRRRRLKSRTRQAPKRWIIVRATPLDGDERIFDEALKG